MTVQEIYEKYRIMPNLQLHQLRVAAVAKVLADAMTLPIDKDIPVRAALFHDMGNIIKSDLTLFPQFSEPEGRVHWESVKDDFIKRYGSDAHHANNVIAHEIHLPAEVVEIIEDSGFSNMQKILASDSFEIKIFEYADIRVGPFGVLSVVERLREARARYQADYKRKTYYETNDNFEALAEAAQGIEGQISEYSTIKPTDITDETVAPYIEMLRTLTLA